MTAVEKAVPSPRVLPRTVREPLRAGCLPLCAAFVLGLLARPYVLRAGVPDAGGGTISGTVVDTRSRSVPFAMVHAYITATAGEATEMLVPQAETDASGRFAIQSVPWGTYQVVADKPGAGYPSTIIFRGLYGRDRAAEVTVSPQAPAAAVTVRIGPKAGFLSWTIVNAGTGKLLTRAVFDLSSGRARAVVGDAAPAHFTLPVPSEMVLTLTVHAPGFELWRWTGELTPGEREDFTIHLRSSGPKAGTP
jgi:hypothetical protein